MKTMTFRVRSRVHIAVQNHETPADEEWTAYLSDIKAHLTEIDAVLTFTAGGGPTAKQRDATLKFWAGETRKPRIAILTPSTFVRTLATALGWAMGQQIRAFGADDLDGAFSYLHLTALQRREAKDELARLRHAISAPTGAE
jgi:hypothetical protein